MLDRIFEALDAQFVDAVARLPHYEQISHALIEQQLRWHPRVGARQESSEGLLPLARNAFAPREIAARMDRLAHGPARVAFEQGFHRVVRRMGSRLAI